jgi:hypothetical protein
LTKAEIDSALPSKSTYSRAEVVDLIYGYGSIFDARWQALRTQLITENDTRFLAWKQAYESGLAGLRTENTWLWIIESALGAGLVVYGIYKLDPAVIATGGLMAGGGALRLVIALQ